jgi:hypothetical protein
VGPGVSIPGSLLLDFRGWDCWKVPDAAWVFLQLVGKQMVGIYLSIWVRRALLRQIRGVQVTTIGTGIMGYLGNKGTPAPSHTFLSTAFHAAQCF